MGRKKITEEMVSIKVIIILTTPYHKKAIQHLFPDYFNCENTLLLHSAILDVSDLGCQKYTLTNYEFSRKKIFTAPLEFVKPFRKKIKAIITEIVELNSMYLFETGMECYFGSDKDIFTQIFLDKLKPKLTKVTVVDEGLGFYLRLSIKDKFIAFLYSLITPVLFGQRLYYIKRLGVLPLINIVYVRDKNLLPKLIKDKEYKEFRLKNMQTKRAVEFGKILFFSFPEQDFVIDPKEKAQIHLSVANFLAQYGRRLVIKPHPRENTEYLKNALKGIHNISILEGNQLGEELDYFEYEIIINVFSSMILDLIESFYPKQRILTLGYAKKPPMKFDEDLKYIPLNKFNIKDHLNFES